MLFWKLADRPGERWSWTLVGEFIAAVTAMVFLLELPRVLAHIDPTRLTNLTMVLAFCAAGAGATSAILCRLSARLREEPHSLWLCLALLVYTFIAIPAATIGATSRWDEAAVGNIRLFAHTAFVALICLMAFTPRAPRWLTVTTGMSLVLAATTVLGWLGETYPDESLAVTTSPAARWGLTALWLLGPLLVITSALYQRCDTLYRIGIGLEIVAVAHTLRVNEGNPAAALSLSFSVMRLLGVLLMLAVAIAVTHRCLTSVDHDNHERRRQLHQAQIELERARERDHELRNGLAGLAGAARYIHNGGEHSTLLQRAITAELARLNAMMRQPPEPTVLSHSKSTLPSRYSVEEVLHDQIALRRSIGMDVRLDSDPRLLAVGSPATLAQVISNLLANCERHAPGSPVRIQACEAGSIIRIRVTDFGPGVPLGVESTLFDLGVRGTNSDGQGIGLHVSLRLLQAERGTIVLVPGRVNRPGCTVLIELPLATPVLREDPDEEMQPDSAATAVHDGQAA